MRGGAGVAPPSLPDRDWCLRWTGELVFSCGLICRCRCFRDGERVSGWQARAVELRVQREPLGLVLFKVARVDADVLTVGKSS